MAGIEIINITGKERDRLLALEEGTFIELKGIEVAPRKLSITISAFANTVGGDLYIGITENEFFGSKIRHWRGFEDQEDANGHIQALETLFPLGAEYSYEFLRVPGSHGLVLHMGIQRTVQIVSASNKKVFVRRGAQNLEVKGSALERLKLDKGIHSFEKQTVDVNIRSVSESEVIKKFVNEVVPNLEPKRFLKKQNLIKGNKPIVAAVLLFSDDPQAALPKRSGVKLYRYKTMKEAAREFLAEDPISIEGPIYDLIKFSVDKTAALVEGIQKLGPSGLEPVSYPLETLHEIVTNAILHRDYSIPSDVMIRVFDNRIEVESPGPLPGHITIKNILNEQFARNGIIVRLINKFPNPPNKDVGEGLNTAFKAMQKLRLKPPIIKDTQNCVLVKIRHESLASPEETVMDYLENHAEITNRVARELTGVASENSMKDVFLRLAKRNLIKRVEGKKGAAAAWEKFNTTS